MLSPLGPLGHLRPISHSPSRLTLRSTGKLIAAYIPPPRLWVLGLVILRSLHIDRA